MTDRIFTEPWCVACGADDRLVSDHVVPRSLGGTNHPTNKQILCWSCNSSKGAKSMSEWLERERGIGMAPRPIPRVHFRQSGEHFGGRPNIIYTGVTDCFRWGRDQARRWRYPLVLTVTYPVLTAR